MNALQNDNSVVIRDIEISDIEKLSDFYLDLFKGSGHVITIHDAYKQAYANEKILEIEDPKLTAKKTALALNNSNAVLGYVEYLRANKETIYVFDMFVKERNKGIGTALIDYLADQGKQDGVRNLEVTAMEGNFDFYRKVGFTALTSTDGKWLAEMKRALI